MQSFHRHQTRTHILPIVIALTLPVMAGCAAPITAVDLGDRAAVDIGDVSQGGVHVDRLKTPVGYKQGDNLVTYEGPGWETDLVGYRLYLDGRNAIDIFGKTVPNLVLSRVGRGDDYHSMSDWGMDILKVGDSLGAGGFGVFDGSEAVQIGKAERYSAEVKSDGDDAASLRVTHHASLACQGDVVATYAVKAGSRLTQVSVDTDCVPPIAAGLVVHPDTEAITSDDEGGWQYIARFGQQSLVPDALGLALFYRAEDVVSVGEDDDDMYVIFKDGTSPHYFTGATWEQEVGASNQGAIITISQFREWLLMTQTDLNNNLSLD